MEARNQPFTKIVSGPSQFVIPVFQRDYTWTDAHCEELWKDILCVADAKDDGGHFFGSVVYVPTGDSSAGLPRWLLIDGQQRVTTLTLLLAALRDHIVESGWEDPAGDVTPKRIEADYLRNNEEEGKRTYKLVLRRKDQDTLASIVHGEERPDDVSERIVEAYEYFRDRIAEEDPATVYKGFGRLIVVDVTLDRYRDDPQLIFESLNSTGVDLSQSDLIRNFILMKLTEAEQTRLYELHWSKIETMFQGSEKTFDAFARDYLALQTQASKQEKADNIYRAFRAYFPKLLELHGSLEQTLQELRRYAGYYAGFMTGKGVSKDLSGPLASVRQLGAVPAILVMRLYDCLERLSTMTPDEFIEAMRLIESYLFRRAICGEQTRGYWQIFSSLAYSIDENSPLDSLKVSLALQSESARFPENKEFKRELLERDIYGLRICHHLLDRLENDGSKEPTDTSFYSIEHILPQNERLVKAWRDMLGKDWKEVQRKNLHKLGNLTLTGYNSSYQDRPFHEKKTIPGGFEESSVRLNKYVREQEKWTGEQIGERGSLLARSSLEVWPPLSVDASLVQAEKEKRTRYIAARRDVANVPMKAPARSLFELLRDPVKEIDGGIFEIAEKKSVSYHGPEFFLEVLPREYYLTLLLAIDFNEVDNESGIAHDASKKAFFRRAEYEGGVMVYICKEEDVAAAVPIIRQSFRISSS